MSDEFGLNGSLIHTQWSEDYQKFDLDIDKGDDRGATIEAIFQQIDVSGLEGALDGAGWQTSSSYC